MKTTEVKTESGIITIYSINNDYYGNPRYVVHFLSLGLPDYITNDKTRKAGLTKYRGKQFGGGYAFQSYAPAQFIKRALTILNN